MKTLILVAFMVQAAFAAEAPKDLLAGFGGPVGFCNVLEKAKRLPMDKTSCLALILISKSDYMASGDRSFGKVQDTIESSGENIYLISEVTLEDLEVLRFDERIIVLAPDFPMGGVGSFTVRN